jgi:hypothetical protein
MKHILIPVKLIAVILISGDRVVKPVQALPDDRKPLTPPTELSAAASSV